VSLIANVDVALAAVVVDVAHRAGCERRRKPGAIQVPVPGFRLQASPSSKLHPLQLSQKAGSELGKYAFMQPPQTNIKQGEKRATVARACGSIDCLSLLEACKMSLSLAGSPESARRAADRFAWWVAWVAWIRRRGNDGLGVWMRRMYLGMSNR
jgi:hypothetical protein